MRLSILVAAGLAVGVTSFGACDRSAEEGSDALPLAPGAAPDVVAGPAAQEPPNALRRSNATLDPELCSLRRGGFTLESENDFFPLAVGDRWVYAGEEDGEVIRLRITVLNETERVGNVRTRVVEEREWIDGELVEVSRNFYALARDETVCYFGEEVDIYEDGEIVSHEGAWRADAAGNRPGIFMPADPRLGMRFVQEGAPGVAEDEATIVGVGQTVRVPAGTFRETIRIRELNPLDGGTGFKVYAEDVGLVIDGPVELVRYRVRDDD